MSGCTCRPCKPKWQKFTDKAIYSNSDADHLISYIVFHKDKTEKVVIYLYSRIVNDLNKKYSSPYSINNSTYLLKEIMAKGTINDFNFDYILKSSTALLETNEYAYKKMGCDIFESFCRLHQNTVAFYDEYDTLIKHFTAMSLSTNYDRSERISTRIFGINGIHGLVKIVANENSRGNVITSNMQSIISVLLTNIHYGTTDSTMEKVSDEAQMTLRTVLYRTPKSELPNLVDSILLFLDKQPAWNDYKFVEKIFTLYIESLNKSDNGLLKKLIQHLEPNQDIDIRIGVVRAIPKITDLLSQEVIGPEVIYNFKNLISSLLKSIKYTDDNSKEGDMKKHQTLIKERNYQENACEAILKYSQILTDHQKTIILRVICDELVYCFPKEMMSYSCSIVQNKSHDVYSVPFIRILMKIMFSIVSQYSNVSISNGLDSELFLILLNKVALAKDPGIRLIVQRILHVFIDQRQVLKAKVRLVRYHSASSLNNYPIEEPSDEDILFMRKSGNLLTQNLYCQLLEPINRVDNFEHLNCTISLLAMKVSSQEVISELFRLILQVQEKAVEFYQTSPSYLPKTHHCAIHSVVASCATILGFLIKNPALSDHISKVIESRKNEMPYLLPENAFNRSNTQESYPTDLSIPESCLFDRGFIQKELAKSEYPVVNFDKPYSEIPPYSNHSSSKHDQVDHHSFIEDPMLDNFGNQGSSEVIVTNAARLSAGNPKFSVNDIHRNSNMPLPFYNTDNDALSAISLIDSRDDNESNRSSRNSLEYIIKNINDIDYVRDKQLLLTSSDLSIKNDQATIKAKMNEIHDNINAEIIHQTRFLNSQPSGGITSNVPLKEWSNKFKDSTLNKTQNANQFTSKDPELEMIDAAIKNHNNLKGNLLTNTLIDNTTMMF